MMNLKIVKTNFGKILLGKLPSSFGITIEAIYVLKLEILHEFD
jgi:hypothetical protein